MDVQREIVQSFIDAEVDLIFSITTPGTLIAKEMTSEIPIVFSVNTFPVESGVIDSLESSSNNLVGTRNYISVERQYSAFERIYPNTETLAFIHHKDEPIHFSVDNADLISNSTIAISLEQASISSDILDPIIRIDNPAIRISSLRVRDNAVLVTLYNLENKEIDCQISVSKKIQSITETKIDGIVLNEQRVNEELTSLKFSSREIKMCALKFT